MRTLHLLLFLALPLFLLAQTKTERKILDTEQRRFGAMTSKDTLALRELLADDLVYIHSNALTESKPAHISAISTGRLVYEQMIREQVKVRRYGKTALTNGIVQVKGILNEKTFEMRLAYTAVYRKKGGDWQLANWQSTRVP